MKLLDYLKKVLALENDKFILTQTINSMQTNIQAIQTKNDSLQPDYPEKPRFPSMPTEPDLPSVPISIPIFLYVLVLVAFNAFINIMVVQPAPDSNHDKMSASFMFFVVTAILGAIPLIAAVTSISCKKRNYIEYLDECENIKKKYNADCEVYEVNKQQAEYECDDTRTMLSKYVSEQKDQLAGLYDKFKEVENALDRIYSCNIVFKKYRGLVPVAMFCEYIESGRCSDLEGHEGAYNIYENELRMDVIKDKLDLIANKLDDIRSNQYVLYESLIEANNVSSQICRQISQQSQIIAQASLENQSVQREQTRLLEFNNQIAQDIRNVQFYDTFL